MKKCNECNEYTCGAQGSDNVSETCGNMGSVMKYNVILADPPWTYKSDMHSGHRSTDHYPSMTNEEMQRMDIKSVCDKECVLYMWTTTPNLLYAIQLGQSWGFEYKQVAFVWDKVNPCNGNYTITQVELVLVFRPKRGKLPKRAKTNVRQMFVEKKRQHSRKPEYVQDMLDLMYPTANKLELFARRTRNGWSAWGNETTKFD
jgi:N6-adenosine-specific RNA methylase IME4